MSVFANFSELPPLSLQKNAVIFIEEEINTQKKCVPGPNVKFSKNAVPFSEYISNISNPGSLGCNPDQYPKYTQNGKYCCENEMASPQEQFNYINMLLKYAIENVGETSFKKYSRDIEWLKNMREYLIQKYSENNLTDTLVEQFPMTIDGEPITAEEAVRLNPEEYYNNLNDYISRNIKISNELAMDREYKNLAYGINQGNEIFNNTKRNVGKLSNNQASSGGKSYRKTTKRRKGNRTTKMICRKSKKSKK